MKELDKLNKDVSRHQVEQETRKQENIEYKPEYSILPHRGHHVWEINKETKEVKKAEFHTRKDVEIIDGTVTINKEIVMKPNCYYISALNPKNALRRLKLNKGHAQILPTDYKMIKIQNL